MADAGGERYAEFDPPASLKPWVRCLWTYAAPAPSRAIQRIAPDGCPELIVDIAGPYEEQDADGAFFLQPSRIFAGQMTRPIAIRPVGPVEIVAVRFEPDGARDWLGVPLSRATDRRLDVVARMSSFAAPPSGAPERQVGLLSEWLEAERRAGDWRIDASVREECRAIVADEAPAARSPADQRALQRRFLDRVGVSPRMLRAVHRFRRVFDHIAGQDADRGPDQPDWLEAALDAGYFDQPQMARDFRRFLGCTATQWARDQMELARALASQTYKPGAASAV